MMVKKIWCRIRCDGGDTRWDLSQCSHLFLMIEPWSKILSHHPFVPIGKTDNLLGKHT